jgi:hypothetical protein
LGILDLIGCKVRSFSQTRVLYIKEARVHSIANSAARNKKTPKVQQLVLNKNAESCVNVPQSGHSALVWQLAAEISSLRRGEGKTADREVCFILHEIIFHRQNNPIPTQ